MSLALDLKLGEKKLSVDDFPDAKVRLINQGSDMIIVNARMLLAPFSYPPMHKEVSFFVSGPEGSVNMNKFRVNAGKPTIENFVRLFPGEYIFQTYELSKYFSFSIKGEYKIIVEYSNVASFIIHDKMSWQGKIISNEEYFELL